MNTLNYNFHDATLVKCEISRNNQLQLTVQLYEIYYPNKELIKLTFSEVFNIEKVSKLVVKLKAEALNDDWNGTRINTIQFDTKRTSTNQNLFLFLDLDWYEPIRIHCKRIKEEFV
ncbi:MAG: hypothetical protein MI810_21375 [Flavobacteriales bacterium]|nr:hypothetical protein [Flavobacteriales bacterium]